MEVRLVGMDSPNVGHVQVKYNGTWGAICSWLSYQSEKVMCRQLGHGLPVKFRPAECPAKNEGAERMWIDGLECRGFEDSIDQCLHRGWGRLGSDCQYCTPQRCSRCPILSSSTHQCRRYVK